MAYTLHDEDGHVGHGPSVGGLRNLKKFLSTQTAKHPALDMLLLHGVTQLTTKLAVECRLLATKAKTDPDVESTLTSLAASADHAKGIVVLVSHGVA